MKIQNTNLGPINPYQKNINVKPSQTSGVFGKDQLEISPEAKQMQEVVPYALERQNRISEIKRQVESGEYKVNEFDLAKKMYTYYNRNK